MAACVFFQDIYWKSLVSLFFSAVYVSSFDEKKSLKNQFFALFHSVSVFLFPIPILKLSKNTLDEFDAKVQVFIEPPNFLAFSEYMNYRRDNIAGSHGIQQFHKYFSKAITKINLYPTNAKSSPYF